MKLMDSSSIIAIGVLISVSGAIISGIGAFRASRDNARKQDLLLQKTEENAELANEIAKLNKEIAFSLTGGDSYCEVSFSGLETIGPGKFQIDLISTGKYPIYDLTIKVIDYQIYFLHYREGKHDLEAASTLINIGNMNPHVAAMLATIEYPKNERLEYIVELKARNGFFVQFIKYVFINNKWEKAIRLIRTNVPDQPDSILKTSIDKGFPLNEKGEVDWQNQNPYKPIK